MNRIAVEQDKIVTLAYIFCASRTLSNFGLSDVERRFWNYCESPGHVHHGGVEAAVNDRRTRLATRHAYTGLQPQTTALPLEKAPPNLETSRSIYTPMIPS